ncbi:hypothetical protein E9993_11195 [Labilibacter sediminis]|nr:hypothetical protein E9993_11195 [Labilibacter sediminis]
MKRILRYISFLFLGILLLILGAGLFVQSHYGQNKIKELALTELNKIIDGNISIQRFSGNLISNIKLNDILLISHGDTVGEIRSIELHYKIRKLLQRNIHIDSLLIDSPFVLLKMEEDSVLNLNRIFQTSDSTKKSGKPFAFDIKLGLVDLKNGSTKNTGFNPLIPTQLENININLAGNYSKDLIIGKLNSFNFKSQNPHLQIKQLCFNTQYSQQGFTIDSLLLKTRDNQFNINGRYKSTSNFKGQLSSSPIHLPEFNFFIPTLHLIAIPKVKLNTTAQNDTLKLNGTITNNQELISIESYIVDVNKKDLTNHKFNLNLVATNVKLSNWGLKSDLPVILNGKINTYANSFNFKHTPLYVNASLNNSSAYGFKPDTFLIKGTYTPQKTLAQININDYLGSAFIDLELNKTKDDYSYSMYSSIRNFKIDSLVSSLTPSVLNLETHLSGHGFDTKSMTVNADIYSANSEISEIKIDTLASNIHISSGTVHINKLLAHNANESIYLNGLYHINPNYFEANFEASLNNLNDIKPFINDLNISSKASIEGNISGPPDSLILNSNFIFEQPQFDNIVATKAEGNCNINLTNNYPGLINIEATELNIDPIVIDTLNISSNIRKNRYYADVFAINNSEFQLKMSTALLTYGDTLSINIPALNINTHDIKLYNKHKNLSIDITEGAYSFNFIELLDQYNKEFRFKLDGIYNPSGSSDLSLNISQFNLSFFNKWINQEKLLGQINLNTTLKGHGENPYLTTSIDIDSLQYKMLSPPKIISKINISDKVLDGHLNFSTRLGDSINAKINLPLIFNLTNNNIGLLDTYPIKGGIKCEKINLHEYMRKNTPFTNTDGIVSFDISLEGTNKEPALKGFLQLTEGKIHLPKYGIDYTGIKTRLSILENNLSLDSLYIKSGNGYFLSTGKLKIDSTAIQGQLNDLELDIKANRFHLSKAKAHDIVFNSDIQVRKRNNKPQYTGNIDVLRSSFYLPDLIKLTSSDQNENKPLLVQATSNYNIDSIRALDSLNIKDTLEINPLLPTIQDLTGIVKITIPKNTWIKSEELKLEISGDIDVVKNGDQFELLGEIEIFRGNYFLYGRRFNFTDGEIIFTGGEKFEPLINIEAEYVFRGADREIQTLKLLISGTSEEPELNFTLNGNSINENEAISYIIYNRSSDEIGYDNQKGLASAVSSGIMSKMVSSQLNKTIGNRLNLDMIELNTEDNWQSMDFVVGKYITNDLFVIYQKGFGENNNNEITPESVTLEYEILKNLFIQIQSGNSNTSGIDLILKFEQQAPIKKLK